MRHRGVSKGILLALALLLAAGLPSTAAAGIEEEATRQLELAEEDLAAGNFERAAASAASALRLNPALQEALVTRGLALKGLGRLEDAAALLRAYADLRGTLPLDERVQPALDDIERARTAVDEPVEPEDVTTTSGPLAVLYGPDAPQASEAAYAAARPFLGGVPAASSQPLSTVLSLSQSDLVVLGADAEDCAGVSLEGTLEDRLGAATDSAYGLESADALASVADAERHLACGAGPVDNAVIGKLLGVRAAAHRVAGEPEVASRLWHEMFTVVPAASIDADMPPAAQALQLDAKARAGEAPVLAEVVFALEDGWAGWIDGVAIEDGRAEVAAGRRVVRLVGPVGETLGAIVPVPADAEVVAGTSAGVTSAIYTEPPEDVLLGWLASRLRDVAAQEDAVGALVVNLSTDPPTVRRFEGGAHLVLTTSRGRGRRIAGTTGGASGTQPPVGSIVLLGGGLAATAVGIIVAAVAHSDGVGLQDGMATVSGYDAAYAGYEAARTREQVGIGIAIGGGVVAAVGGVTFAIPQPRATGKASSE